MNAARQGSVVPLAKAQLGMKGQPQTTKRISLFVEPKRTVPLHKVLLSTAKLTVILRKRQIDPVCGTKPKPEISASDGWLYHPQATLGIALQLK